MASCYLAYYRSFRCRGLELRVFPWETPITRIAMFSHTRTEKPRTCGTLKASPALRPAPRRLLPAPRGRQAEEGNRHGDGQLEEIARADERSGRRDVVGHLEQAHEQVSQAGIEVDLDDDGNGTSKTASQLVSVLRLKRENQHQRQPATRGPSPGGTSAGTCAQTTPCRAPNEQCSAEPSCAKWITMKTTTDVISTSPAHARRSRHQKHHDGREGEQHIRSLTATWTSVYGPSPSVR